MQRLDLQSIAGRLSEEELGAMRVPAQPSAAEELSCLHEMLSGAARPCGRSPRWSGAHHRSAHGFAGGGPRLGSQASCPSLMPRPKWRRQVTSEDGNIFGRGEVLIVSAT